MATSAEPEPPRPVAPPGEYLLWCGTCSRVETQPLCQLDNFASGGWPQCCGRQMFCWSGR